MKQDADEIDENEKPPVIIVEPERVKRVYGGKRNK